MSSRSALTTTLFLAITLATMTAPAETVHFRNAHWFDGESFVERGFTCVDGILRNAAPEEGVDRVVDLEGRWVVPAFGEAHNHNVNRPASQREVDRYLSEGVLYVMIHNNMPSLPGRAAIDSPLEVLFSNGGFTPSGGHVVELYDSLLERGVLGNMKKEALDGLAYVIADELDDVDAKWSRTVEQKPDFIKIYLGFSEETAQRTNTADWYGKRGLDPKIAGDIVRRAHQAGLRVSAHIETAADFRTALDVGVDLIAHLPGWRVGPDAGFKEFDAERWLISKETAELAASRNVPVMTTTLAIGTAADPSKPFHEEIRDIHRRNLETLRSAGVDLIIGSDRYAGTSIPEALFLAKQNAFGDTEPLGVLDNLTILRMLSQATPQTILPGRKVGSLEEGFEANFTVLAGDPIEDIANLRRVDALYKQGVLVTAATGE